MTMFCYIILYKDGSNAVDNMALKKKTQMVIKKNSKILKQKQL